MESPSAQVFENLKSWKRLEQLIANGESEGLYYECKAPSEPKIGKDLRLQISKACSGFSNTNGGILIYGISTTKHAHSGLDVMSQLEPIGMISSFESQVSNIIPTLTTPNIIGFQTKIIKKEKGDTRGILLVHIPKHEGDPVQSNIDNTFYFRTGDDFSVAPYEIIKRLFTATKSPDLSPLHVPKLIKKQPNGALRIPIVLQNTSSAIGEHTIVILTIQGTSQIKNITSASIRNASEINPDSGHTYIQNCKEVIHKGMNSVIGHLDFEPTTEITEIEINVRILSHRMEPRIYTYKITFNGDKATSGIIKLTS